MSHLPTIAELWTFQKHDKVVRTVIKAFQIDPDLPAFLQRVHTCLKVILVSLVQDLYEVMWRLLELFEDARVHAIKERLEKHQWNTNWNSNVKPTHKLISSKYPVDPVSYTEEHSKRNKQNVDMVTRTKMCWDQFLRREND